MNDASNSHFYGFADEEEGKRIYFQRDGERKASMWGQHLSEEFVRSSSVGSAKLEKGTVMAGVVEIVDKGRVTSGGSLVSVPPPCATSTNIPPWVAPKKNSTVLYQQLALPCGGDDLWALFAPHGGQRGRFRGRKDGQNLAAPHEASQSVPAQAWFGPPATGGGLFPPRVSAATKKCSASFERFVRKNVIMWERFMESGLV